MYQNILVPLDGSSDAKWSLSHARAIVKAFQVEKVFLLRVLKPFSSSALSRISARKLEIVGQSSKVEAWKYLSEIAGILKKEGINAEPAVVTGKPAKGIIDFAKSNDVDFIVMPHVGRE
ncbi:universal stress protein [Chloroflexota bacterium]